MNSITVFYLFTFTYYVSCYYSYDSDITYSAPAQYYPDMQYQTYLPSYSEQYLSNTHNMIPQYLMPQNNFYFQTEAYLNQPPIESTPTYDWNAKFQSFYETGNQNEKYFNLIPTTISNKKSKKSSKTDKNGYLYAKQTFYDAASDIPLGLEDAESKIKNETLISQNYDDIYEDYRSSENVKNKNTTSIVVSHNNDSLAVNLIHTSPSQVEIIMVTQSSTFAEEHNSFESNQSLLNVTSQSPETDITQNNHKIMLSKPESYRNETPLALNAITEQPSTSTNNHLILRKNIYESIQSIVKNLMKSMLQNRIGKNRVQVSDLSAEIIHQTEKYNQNHRLNNRIFSSTIDEHINTTSTTSTEYTENKNDLKRHRIIQILNIPKEQKVIPAITAFGIFGKDKINFSDKPWFMKDVRDKHDKPTFNNALVDVKMKNDFKTNTPLLKYLENSSKGILKKSHILTNNNLLNHVSTNSTNINHHEIFSSKHKNIIKTKFKEENPFNSSQVMFGKSSNIFFKQKFSTTSVNNESKTQLQKNLYLNSKNILEDQSIRKYVKQNNQQSDSGNESNYMNTVNHINTSLVPLKNMISLKQKDNFLNIASNEYQTQNNITKYSKQLHSTPLVYKARYNKQNISMITKPSGVTLNNSFALQTTTSVNSILSKDILDTIQAIVKKILKSKSLKSSINKTERSKLFNRFSQNNKTRKSVQPTHTMTESSIKVNTDNESYKQQLLYQNRSFKHKVTNFLPKSKNLHKFIRQFVNLSLLFSQNESFSVLPSLKADIFKNYFSSYSKRIQKVAKKNSKSNKILKGNETDFAKLIEEIIDDKSLFAPNNMKPVDVKKYKNQWKKHLHNIKKKKSTKKNKLLGRKSFQNISTHVTSYDKALKKLKQKVPIHKNQLMSSPSVVSLPTSPSSSYKMSTSDSNSQYKNETPFESTSATKPTPTSCTVSNCVPLPIEISNHRKNILNHEIKHERNFKTVMSNKTNNLLGNTTFKNIRKLLSNDILFQKLKNQLPVNRQGIISSLTKPGFLTKATTKSPSASKAENDDETKTSTQYATSRVQPSNNEPQSYNGQPNIIPPFNFAPHNIAGPQNFVQGSNLALNNMAPHYNIHFKINSQKGEKKESKSKNYEILSRIKKNTLKSPKTSKHIISNLIVENTKPHEVPMKYSQGKKEKISVARNKKKIQNTELNINFKNKPITIDKNTKQMPMTTAYKSPNFNLDEKITISTLVMLTQNMTLLTKEGNKSQNNKPWSKTNKMYHRLHTNELEQNLPHTPKKKKSNKTSKKIRKTHKKLLDPQNFRKKKKIPQSSPENERINTENSFHINTSLLLNEFHRKKTDANGHLIEKMRNQMFSQEDYNGNGQRSSKYTNPIDMNDGISLPENKTYYVETQKTHNYLHVNHDNIRSKKYKENEVDRYVDLYDMVFNSSEMNQTGSKTIFDNIQSTRRIEENLISSTEKYLSQHDNSNHDNIINELNILRMSEKLNKTKKDYTNTPENLLYVTYPKHKALSSETDVTIIYSKLTGLHLTHTNKNVLTKEDTYERLDTNYNYTNNNTVQIPQNISDVKRETYFEKQQMFANLPPNKMNNSKESEIDNAKTLIDNYYPHQNETTVRLPTEDSYHYVQYEYLNYSSTNNTENNKKYRKSILDFYLKPQFKLQNYKSDKTLYVPKISMPNVSDTQVHDNEEMSKLANKNTHCYDQLDIDDTLHYDHITGGGEFENILQPNGKSFEKLQNFEHQKFINSYSEGIIVNNEKSLVSSILSHINGEKLQNLTQRRFIKSEEIIVNNEKTLVDSNLKNISGEKLQDFTQPKFSNSYSDKIMANNEKSLAGSNVNHIGGEKLLNFTQNKFINSYSEEIIVDNKKPLAGYNQNHISEEKIPHFTQQKFINLYSNEIMVNNEKSLAGSNLNHISGEKFQNFTQKKFKNPYSDEIVVNNEKPFREFNLNHISGEKLQNVTQQKFINSYSDKIMVNNEKPLAGSNLNHISREKLQDFTQKNFINSYSDEIIVNNEKSLPGSNLNHISGDKLHDFTQQRFINSYSDEIMVNNEKSLAGSNLNHISQKITKLAIDDAYYDQFDGFNISDTNRIESSTNQILNETVTIKNSMSFNSEMNEKISEITAKLEANRNDGKDEFDKNELHQNKPEYNSANSSLAANIQLPQHSFPNIFDHYLDSVEEIFDVGSPYLKDNPNP